MCRSCWTAGCWWFKGSMWQHRFATPQATLFQPERGQARRGDDGNWWTTTRILCLRIRLLMATRQVISSLALRRSRFRQALRPSRFNCSTTITRTAGHRQAWRGLCGWGALRLITTRLRIIREMARRTLRPGQIAFHETRSLARTGLSTILMVLALRFWLALAGCLRTLTRTSCFRRFGFRSLTRRLRLSLPRQAAVRRLLAGAGRLRLSTCRLLSLQHLRTCGDCKWRALATHFRLLVKALTAPGSQPGQRLKTLLATTDRTPPVTPREATTSLRGTLDSRLTAQPRSAALRCALRLRSIAGERSRCWPSYRTPQPLLLAAARARRMKAVLMARRRRFTPTGAPLTFGAQRSRLPLLMMRTLAFACGLQPRTMFALITSRWRLSTALSTPRPAKARRDSLAAVLMPSRPQKQGKARKALARVALMLSNPLKPARALLSLRLPAPGLLSMWKPARARWAALPMAWACWLALPTRRQERQARSLAAREFVRRIDRAQAMPLWVDRLAVSASRMFQGKAVRLWVALRLVLGGVSLSRLAKGPWIGRRWGFLTSLCEQVARLWALLDRGAFPLRCFALHETSFNLKFAGV